MPLLKSLIGSLLCIILLCGPRLTTQSIAWAGMLVKNIPQKGLQQGLGDTFDGLHPCNLCNVINEYDATKDKSFALEDQKLVFYALCTQQHIQTLNNTCYQNILHSHGWPLHCYDADIVNPPPIA